MFRTFIDELLAPNSPDLARLLRYSEVGATRQLIRDEHFFMETSCGLAALSMSAGRGC
ncbi:MAG: hypothetical protein Q8O52_23060 [Sulfuritalea sp.]|nr:hypothetical protein [Sulfuritalea sp.]